MRLAKIKVTMTSGTEDRSDARITYVRLSAHLVRRTPWVMQFMLILYLIQLLIYANCDHVYDHGGLIMNAMVIMQDLIMTAIY